MAFFRDQKIRDLEDIIRMQEEMLDKRQESIDAVQRELDDAREHIKRKTKVEELVAVSELMRERNKLDARIEDLEHELRLARQHLNVCDRWEQVAGHDADKAASNR